MYQLRRVQQIPISLKQSWDFFSAPGNLPKLIPGDLDFTVLTDSALDAMYAGQIITYRLKPLFGIPYHWVTEITHVQNQAYFVDEQRFGPYAFWHHTHFFREIPGGTEVTDLVHYKIPFHFIGRIAHSLFVKKKLEDIFAYRMKVLNERFGTMNQPVANPSF